MIVAPKGEQNSAYDLLSTFVVALSLPLTDAKPKGRLRGKGSL